jgi:hypothetical protein
VTFSSFVLEEGLKNKQVLTLHRFNELYRDQVMLDLHDRLDKAWATEVKSAKAHLSKAEAEEALLQNPAALTSTMLNHGPVKSHYGNKHVSPSVSIPLTLPQERRNLLEKNLLDAAEECFTQLIAHWAEAFSFEKTSGKLGSDFKIKRDERTVRLVLAGSGSTTVTHEAVICYVTVERGKPNTKRKAYDLVALCAPGRDT